ncbi:MAG: choice-of-anchor L domain-containing protein [Bacteroidia bacterium]|nr:choice-of-anchor L domain-containing protein [Bacteroidia bacterium]
MNKKLLTIFLLLSSPLVRAQLVFDTTSNVEQMVRQVFQSDGVEIKNIRFTGYDKAIRVFHNSKNNMPMQAGIFLATGHYNTAKGPNLSASSSYSTDAWGDRQLTDLAGYSTYDAAILEFDFIPSGSTVSFQYLFASEEYPEYVGSKFNDVFAFFISGPGIKGFKNMALLPGTRDAVTINNVNYKKHKQYYIDNEFKVYDPFSMEPDSSEIQFDGFTTVLGARAMVIPGKTYHLKIAIADVKDKNYDSGVFLEYGSFKSSGTPARITDSKKGKRQKDQIIILSPRRLSPEPPDHVAQILFDDTVVSSFQNNQQFELRLKKLLPLFTNYPLATFELYCGTHTQAKDSFVRFFTYFMNENGIDSLRIEVIFISVLPAKKNKKQPDSNRVLLTIRQKSRQSED